MMLKQKRLSLILGLLTFVWPLSAQFVISGGGDKKLTLSGYSQMTYDAALGAKGTGNHSFYALRVVVGGNVEIDKHWSANALAVISNRFVPLDMYVNYSYSPSFNVRVGQFKNPLGYENQISPADNVLINFSMMSNYLLGADASNPYFNGTAGRDVGLEVYGKVADNKLRYRLSLLNGSGINKRDDNAAKSIGGSLTWSPIDGLFLQGSALYGKTMVGPSEPKHEVERTQWGTAVAYVHPLFDARAEALWLKMDKDLEYGYELQCVGHLSDKWDIVGSWDSIYKLDNRRDSELVAGVQYVFARRCRLQGQYIWGQVKTPEQTLNQQQVALQFQIGF